MNKNYVIIPAAGKGTRFQELGRQYPKCLLPFENKPIIQYNIELLYDQVELIVIVVQERDLSKFQEILSLYPTYDKIQFKIPDESNTHGPLTSIISGYQIGYDGVLVVLSDIILPNDVDLLTNDTYVSYQKVPDYQRWCLVEENNGLIRYIDKPTTPPGAPDFNALNGIYRVTNDQLEQGKTLLSSVIDTELQISSWLSGINIDRIVNIPVVDFGTLDEYMQQRNIPTCRAFNNINRSNNIIFKSSKDSNKMYKEFSWLNGIPFDLKPYTVRTFELSHHSSGYSMEVVPFPTFREHMIFIGVEEYFDKFLIQFKNYIETERKYKSEINFFDQVVSKTKQRMQSNDVNFTDVEILGVLYKLAPYKELLNSNCSIMHGDCVASNILYNVSSNEMKLIDPNGEMYGSFIYDLAKFNQSLMTPYDYIDSGLYANDYVFSGKTAIRTMWRNFLNENYPEFIGLIDALTVSLMASLVPLHFDRPENMKLYVSWVRDALRSES